MKVFFALAGVALALSGCASPSKTSERDWQRYYSDRAPSSAPMHTCVPKVGPDCKARILWRCPNGFQDACFTPGSTGRHTCVARNSEAECSLRVSMTCPQGFSDGCTKATSMSHECTPDIGVACPQGAMLPCPQGFYDYCEDFAGGGQG